MVFTRIGVGALVAALIVGVMIPSTSSQQAPQARNLVIEHDVAIATGTAEPQPDEQELSGGVMDAVVHARGLESSGGPTLAQALTPQPAATRRTNGCSNVFGGRFTNVRVNQDCSLRRQAEEQIVIDPTDPNHLIAGQNDSRIGFNHCGIDFSFDRGRTWGDMLPPFFQFILKDGHTADAASDPALAFDSRGNAYFSCIVFDAIADANAVVVTKSNAAFGGTFFHTPKPGPTQSLLTNPLGVVANDNDPTIFHDKEFIAADTGATSPKRDRVYVTWTRFRVSPLGQTIESPIYFSESKNGGETWSPGIEISGANGALCVPAPGKCNRDQGSWPVVGPDGTLYVFFNNVNTPTIVAQQMIVTCMGTADCTKTTNWSKPVKVADDFRTQPFYLGPALNDPVTGCPRGRRCLPPNGYRINDFGAGAIDPTTGRLYFSWSDFRNGGPCATMNGLPVEPCANHNNNVFIVSSDDGGSTWSKPTLVSSATHTNAAQWQAWMAVGPDGTVYVAYYDRQYGRCEATGCNDITVAIAAAGEDARGNDDEEGGLTFRHVRITTSSMPNLTPANNPVQAGFLGDYMSIAADAQGAVLVWADTRSPLTPVPEEDVYFAVVPK